MEGYMGRGKGKMTPTTAMRTPKLKRKGVEELDQVSHDFSDFSLSSPATKIRRLDADLPPIMEEEEPEILPPFSSAAAAAPASVGGGAVSIRGGLVIEELECDADPPLPLQQPSSEDDKAIVVFNPSNPFRVHRSPSTLSFSVNSNLISDFKDQFLRSTQYGQQKIEDDDEDDQTVRNSNVCRAVVPYAAPSQFLPPASAGMMEEEEVPQAMTEPPEEELMDIEQEGGIGSLPQELQQQQTPEMGYAASGMGLPQWQQQHCMIPLPPHETYTPITWFR